ncbi:MAG: sigma-54 dependent transcriptional regulator, partial [Syntrophales bacterium]|nr:sigma-54 dependent transcriptional regulator [Syntrophales bacterium]
MAHILVVDDDRGMRDFLEIMLTREGYTVTAVADPERGLQKLKKEKFSLVITDLRMPKMDGIAFLKKVKDLSPESPVILITAFASAETALLAMKEGAYDYIEKDFDVEQMKKIVRDALAKKGTADEKIFKTEAGDVVHFSGMISRSRKMFKVFHTITKVAETTTNVLILGESGTGKELVARAIHEKSPRRHLPFVVINCGGVPENLLESEFFGYMKGAFTGAYTDRAGLFEVARGGTIFLDEIGELSPFLQVKLLRVVQDKTFRRIGGNEDITVDVRIISATNQDLEQKVKDGTFRKDLFYRLNVIPIHLPPLRQRPEDIPILVDHFIAKYAKAFAKDVKSISAYSLELLLSYPFPGNIRELENIIERSVALEGSNIILPENLIITDSDERASLDGDREVPPDGINLNDAVARYEKSLIEAALRRAAGSRTKAAELLRISVDSLYYRMEKLGLHPQLRGATNGKGR